MLKRINIPLFIVCLITAIPLCLLLSYLLNIETRHNLYGSAIIAGISAFICTTEYFIWGIYKQQIKQTVLPFITWNNYLMFSYYLIGGMCVIFLLLSIYMCMVYSTYWSDLSIPGKISTLSLPFFIYLAYKGIKELKKTKKDVDVT